MGAASLIDALVVLGWTADTVEEVWVWFAALYYHLRVDQAEEQTEKVRASGGHWRLTEMLMVGTQHRSKLQGRHNKRGTPANKLTRQ